MWQNALLLSIALVTLFLVWSVWYRSIVFNRDVAVLPERIYPRYEYPAYDYEVLPLIYYGGGGYSGSGRWNDGGGPRGDYGGGGHSNNSNHSNHSNHSGGSSGGGGHSNHSGGGGGHSSGGGHSGGR